VPLDVTISIRRMSLGFGCRYLMESVAAGDGRAGTSSPLVCYYAESGTPPGRFIGHGRGVAAGAEVTEEHLFNLLGMCADPVTGMPLGRRPAREPRPLAERVAQRLAALGEMSEVEREAARTVIEAEERAREQRLARPAAGFDLTFSPSKSVSIAWALGDEATRSAIYEAHQQALAITLAHAEEHVFSSRSGAGGRVEEDINGVIASVFDHWDSRAGDPHLHSHVVVANRGRSVSDGAWRTLDSRKLFGSVVALSELHQGVLEDLLAARLGLSFDARERLHSAAPRWEIAGVPDELIAEFSTRAAAIEAEKERLLACFRAAYGREPRSAEVLRPRQQATLVTRPEKEPPQPRAADRLLARARSASRGRRP
jgi:conjugative relaxase-like TrwC/TraI family protein